MNLCPSQDSGVLFSCCDKPGAQESYNGEPVIVPLVRKKAELEAYARAVRR